MTRRLVLPLLMMLGACVPAAPADLPSRADLTAQSTLAPMKQFVTNRSAAPVRSNSELATDFIELSFQMESGRALPVLTRFEVPVRLRVTGAPPPTLAADLARLIGRLRSEARIDIAQTTGPDANITIEAVSRAEIQGVLPQAACFVAPNVGSLSEYRKARRSARTDWTRLNRRDRLAIFVPNDVSPQEVRDCLHEEIAQALGPLNDLYRLPDSVFNDDNIHTVLTGFDMLILRAYYDPALLSGMTRTAVAAALPALLTRINPAGDAIAGRFTSRTPRGWTDAIQTALSATRPERRLDAADAAVAIAIRMGWQDNRRGFAHYVRGRVLRATDPIAAEQEFLTADRFYAGTPGTDLHRAYVAVQRAALALRRGDGAGTLDLTQPYLNTARHHENAALLATLLLMRSEALDLETRPAESRSVRLDSIGWARYGFGPDWAVRARLREIAALNPLKG